MLSAIGASSSVVPTTGPDPKLSQLQQQLSDCVNCPTANTTEGKAKIQAISDQISAIKSRAQQTQPANANQVPDIQTLIKNQVGFDNRPIQGSAIGGVINISV